MLKVILKKSYLTIRPELRRVGGQCQGSGDCGARPRLFRVLVPVHVPAHGHCQADTQLQVPVHVPAYRHCQDDHQLQVRCMCLHTDIAKLTPSYRSGACACPHTLPSWPPATGQVHVPIHFIRCGWALINDFKYSFKKLHNSKQENKMKLFQHPNSVICAILNKSTVHCTIGWVK